MCFSGASLWWLCLASTSKWAHGDSHGVAEYPELLSWLQHWLSAVTSLSCGPAVVAAALWDVQEVPLLSEVSGTCCKHPARGRFWHNTHRYSLAVLPHACIPMVCLSFPSHRCFSFPVHQVFPLWSHGCDQGVPHRCAEQLLLGHCTSFYPCQKEKINSEHNLALVAESVFFCGC